VLLSHVSLAGGLDELGGGRDDRTRRWRSRLGGGGRMNTNNVGVAAWRI
jgi:hypothetical protein